MPVENAEVIGLHKVFDAGQLEALFAVLRGPSRPEDAQWSRRFKDHQERLHTGDIFVIVGLARDLPRRMRAKGTMLHAEKDMLHYARRPLVAEIALSQGVALAEAEAVLDEAVGGPGLHWGARGHLS